MTCPGAASSFGEILVVSSTTRPTGLDLYAGRYIYEADTGRTMMYDGTGWIVMDEPVQTNASASFAGITTGTPTYANRSQRRGGFCWFTNRVTFGSAPGAITALTVTFPYAAIGVPPNSLQANSVDNGVANYPGWVDGGTTSASVTALLASGTTLSLSAISATSPFSYNVGDVIQVSGLYEMATRYL